MTRQIFTVILTLAVAASSAAQSFRRNQPARVTVEAHASGAIAKAGQSVDLSLTATPLPGIHVYAPGNPNYIAVAVTVLPVAGLSIGAPVFPAGEDYFFGPLKEAVKVYTKPFVVRMPVKVMPAFTKGRASDAPATVTIKGTVDYQACDDKVCFPPQSQPFSVDVPVAPTRR